MFALLIPRPDQRRTDVATFEISKAIPTTLSPAPIDTQ
jgi:hypothetical protein